MVKFNKSKKLIFLWLISFVIIFFINSIIITEVFKLIIPLTAILGFIIIFNYTNFLHTTYTSYFLFFLISLTSLLGFTKTLTGSHAESSNLILYGLSFYSASLAFLLSSHPKKINYVEAFKLTNPLLLITGPISLFLKPLKGRKLISRLNYYLPFMIIGIFFFKIIASPLMEFFFLLDSTDIISAIVFAIIFEIFVYGNFCGLSLLIYGGFGLLGYRIPLNFKQPFSNYNVIDFWKGWHISLSIVLKSLFYNPIRKKFPKFIAILSVFIASSLWHGITPNFLIWGVFHALIFWLTLKLIQNNIRILPTILFVFGIIFGRLLFIESDSEKLFEKLSFHYEGLSIFSDLLIEKKISLFSLFLGFIMINLEFFFQKNKIMKKRNYKFLRSPVALTIQIIIIVLFLTDIGGVDYAVYGQR